MSKDADDYIERYARQHCITKENAMQHEIVKLMIAEYERKEQEKDGSESSEDRIKSKFKAGTC